MSERDVSGTGRAEAQGADHPAYGWLHADATAVLTAFPSPDAQQEGVRRDILAHLAAHPDATAKSGPPAHLTASCVVLDADLDRVLLTHHRKADQWYQLGGHLETVDATVRDGAAREAREESGLEGLLLTTAPVHLDRHTLVGSFGRCREHLDLRYAARAPREATPVVSEESLDVRWWPVGDLPEGTRAELARPVALARAALRALAEEG